jgi:nucleotide-binding universal stress UspA family protein
MASWKKICCAVDPTDASWCAMQEAAELARCLGADLTLVHVRSFPPGSAMDLLSEPEHAGAASPRDDRTLESWRADAQRAAGRPVRIATLTGRPAETIIRYARDQGFDVVVVGTREGSTLGRIVLGSVAERVALGAPCPVLVVRPRTRTEERAPSGHHASQTVVGA